MKIIHRMEYDVLTKAYSTLPLLATCNCKIVSPFPTKGKIHQFSTCTCSLTRSSIYVLWTKWPSIFGIFTEMYELK
jgi:hypothetical protein